MAKLNVKVRQPEKEGDGLSSPEACGVRDVKGFEKRVNEVMDTTIENMGESMSRISERVVENFEDNEILVLATELIVRGAEEKSNCDCPACSSEDSEDPLAGNPLMDILGAIAKAKQNREE